MPGARLSPSEYARRLGLNPSTVCRQIKAGVIPLDGDGLVDVAAADAARDSKLDPGKVMEGALRKRQATGNGNRPARPVVRPPQDPARDPVSALLIPERPAPPQDGGGERRILLCVLSYLTSPAEQAQFAAMALKFGCSARQA